MSIQQQVDRQHVVRDVIAIVGEYVSVAPERIKEATAVQADLGCDSLDMVEISMEVEERFDVVVPEDLAGDRTVAEIADFVLGELGAGASAAC